jgi:hypothetical protein
MRSEIMKEKKELFRITFKDGKSYLRLMVQECYDGEMFYFITDGNRNDAKSVDSSSCDISEISKYYKKYKAMTEKIYEKIPENETAVKDIYSDCIKKYSELISFIDNYKTKNEQKIK